MTDETGQYLADLDALARQIAPIPEGYARLRALLAALPDPTQPAVQQARAGYPEEAAGGSGIGQGLTLGAGGVGGGEIAPGITVAGQMFYGSNNLIQDPTMENMSTVAYALSTVEAAIGPYWKAKYVVNTGAGPTLADLNRQRDRFGDQVNNPFGTSEIEFQVNIPASATTFDVYLRSWPAYTAALVPILPYLLAGIKIRRVNSSTPAAGCTLQARIQILKVDTGVESIVAESTPLNYANMTAFDEVKFLYVAGTDTEANWTTDSYYWRLKLSYAGTGSASSVIRVSIGEPILQWTHTEQMPPFTPPVGPWRPAEINAEDVNDTHVLIRSDPVSGAPGVTLTATGVLTIGGTSFPAAVGGETFYRTDLGLWFTYDGARWLSQQLFYLPLAAETALPFAATTADGHRIALPYHGGQTLRLIGLECPFFVSGGTALGASHKWEADLRLSDVGAATTTTLLATAVSIASGSSSVYRRAAVAAIDSTRDPDSFATLQMTWTKTGTPGNLYAWPVLSYRVQG